MRTTIYIDKEGNVSGLADDILDKLTSLGDRQVERISNVEFNHADKVWEAHDLVGNLIASHPIRGVVIALEREHLNARIEKKFASVI